MTDRNKSGKVLCMSRLLAILLLITLPLSWTATAVAAYCKHEILASEQSHLGHHDDRDHLAVAAPDPTKSDESNTPHTHCCLSHVSYCAFPMDGTNVSTFSILSGLSWLPDHRPLASYFPDEPDRPKWPVTA